MAAETVQAGMDVPRPAVFPSPVCALIQQGGEMLPLLQDLLGFF